MTRSVAVLFVILFLGSSATRNPSNPMRYRSFSASSVYTIDSLQTQGRRKLLQSGLNGSNCTIKAAIQNLTCSTDADCGNSSHNKCNGSCTCGFPFSGELCDPCAASQYATGCALGCNMLVNCSGHGRCSWEDGSCVCFDGWIGPHCNSTITSNRTCSSDVDCGGPTRGHCAGNCICLSPYSGIFCEICNSNLYPTLCNLTCDPSVNCSGLSRNNNCTPGHYLACNRTGLCLPCPVNTFQIGQVGDSTSCLPCPQRTSTNGNVGSYGSASCNCNPEYYQLSIDINSVSPSVATCQICPKGAMCYQNWKCSINTVPPFTCQSSDAIIGNWTRDIGTGLYVLTRCPPGYSLRSIAVTGAPELQECQKCAPGEYIIDPSTGYCQTCPVGMLCRGDNMVLPRLQNSTWVVRNGTLIITGCPTGYKIVSTGPDGMFSAVYQECLPCDAGTECLLGKCESCTPCRAGTYKDVSSAGACQKCEPDTYDPRNGSTLHGDCIACPPMSGTSGMWGQSSVRACNCYGPYYKAGTIDSFWCEQCPKGAMCGSNSCALASSSFPRCQDNASIVGTWVLDDRTQIYLLVDCPPGYSLRGCPPGTAKPPPNETCSYPLQECVQCTQDQYILSPNSDSCQNCPSGLICRGDDVVRPRVPNSTWIRNGSQYVLSACPAGFSMTADGMQCVPVSSTCPTSILCGVGLYFDRGICLPCNNTPSFNSSKVVSWNRSTSDSCSWVCNDGFYRFENSCIACSESPCAIGQYREKCTPFKDGTCFACTNSPSNCSVYISAGDPLDTNNCRWICQAGFYNNGISCAPCNMTECGVGQFRGIPCTLYSDSMCIDCTNKPTFNAFFNGAGRPYYVDNCSWSCSLGYFEQQQVCQRCSTIENCANGGFAVNCSKSQDAYCSYCPTGQYRCIDATCSSIGGCVMCTNKPDHSHYSSEGIPYAVDNCSWTCDNGFFQGGRNCLPCTIECSVGQYLAVPCTTISDAVCKPCSNSPYPGSYYVSSGIPLNANNCSSSCINGYYQIQNLCVSCGNLSCAIGKYRAGCSLTDEGRCESCSAKPSNATYVTAGMPTDLDNCSWMCDVGFYRTGQICVPCNTSRCAVGQFRLPCSPSADSYCTGCTNKPASIQNSSTVCQIFDNTRYIDSGNPFDSNNCLWECNNGYYLDGQLCLACNTTACAVGQYRGFPCNSTFNSACRSCSNKPENSFYVTPGQPYDANTCAWSCNVDFYAFQQACMPCSNTSCSVGYYRGVCTSTSDGVCLQCSNNLDPDAFFTSPGFPFNANNCSWACNAGYFKIKQSCILCSTSICPIGQYVAVGCTSLADRICSVCTIKPANASFTGAGSPDEMNNCPWSCNTGYYSRGDSCLACNVSYCPVGQYRGIPCTSTSDAACVTCTNTIPPNADYSGPGVPYFANACPWSCNLGYFQAGQSCVACTTFTCPVGQYRGVCTTSADAACSECTNSIDKNAVYSSPGSPFNANNCNWTCNAGFFIGGNSCIACSTSLCPIGQYRGSSCTAVSDALCVSCTGKFPANAAYSSPGVPYNTDSCSWSCNSGYYQDNEVCKQCSVIENCSSSGLLVPCTTLQDAYCSYCPTGYYWCIGVACLRSGTCTPCSNRPDNSLYVSEGKPYDSNNCSWACNTGFFRNGQQCTSCTVSDCSTGQYRGLTCSTSKDSACLSCSNKPSSATYVSSGAPYNVNNCSWVCNSGFFGAGQSCVACTTSQCSVGQYRSSCTSSSDGVCVACTTIPAGVDASYISAGNPFNSDNCNWTCNVGFYRTGSSCQGCTYKPCAIGAYRLDCTADGDGPCSACTGKPSNAVYTTQGIPYNLDNCSYVCNTGYFRSGQLCFQCSTATCPIGQYRGTACSSSSDALCVPCSNGPIFNVNYTSPGKPYNSNNCAWACNSGFFISGQSCVPCSTTECLSPGQYRGISCTATSDAACIGCSNKPASNSLYVGPGFPYDANNCSWICNAGYFANKGDCFPCSVSLCPVGQYRGTSCTSTSDAHCVPCSTKPTVFTNNGSQCSVRNDSYYVSAGNPYNINNCAWSCFPSFYLSSSSGQCTSCTTDSCEIGAYRSKCSQTADGTCTSCTNKPSFSSYTSAGNPYDSNNCNWVCNSGFFSTGQQCKACSVSSCPAGHYLLPCTASSDGQCWNCTNKASSNAIYTGAGDVNIDHCSWQCVAGFYRVGDSCISCTPLMSCPEGKTLVPCSSTQDAFCSGCPIGSFELVSEVSSNATAMCVECNQSICGIGLYRGPCGQSSDAQCGSCTNKPTDATYKSPGDPYNSNNCEWACNVGFFKVSSTCLPCNPGSYSAVEGATECELCPSGKYSVLIGAASESDCSLCDVGKFSTSIGATDPSTCIECNPGTFQTNPGQNDCFDCPVNTYSEIAGATQVSDCTACPAKTSTRGGTGQGKLSDCVCDVQYYNLGTNATNCQLCPPGLTCYGNETVVPRVSGSIWEKNSTLYILFACPAGYYMYWGSLGRKAIDPTAQQCIACDVGAECTSPPCDRCTPCLVGFYKTCADAAPCLPCPANQYSQLEGSDSCASCPPGTGTNGKEGQSDVSACVCTFQSYKIRPDDSECEACPPGLTCYGNSTVVPKPLPAGASSWIQNGSVFLLTYCPSGFTIYPGTNAPFDAGAQYCKQCDKGEDCSDPPCVSCNTCRPGYYKSSQLSSLTPLPGYEYDESSQTYLKDWIEEPCQPCPVNTYREVPGGTEVGSCLSCPDLSTTAGRIGQISISACTCYSQYYVAKPAGQLSFCSNCPTGAICEDSTCALSFNNFTCPGSTESIVGQWLMQTTGSQAVAGRFVLESCPQGYSRTYLNTKGQFSHDIQACVKCLSPAQYILDPNFSPCQACPPGLKCNGNNITEPTVFGSEWATANFVFLLTMCPTGYELLNSSIEQQYCSPCKEGSECVSSGCLGCTACEKGKYKTVQSFAPCDLCPADTYNVHIGSKALSDCTACPTGSNTRGKRGQDNKTSCWCPDGQYLDPALQASCFTCPATAICINGNPPIFGQSVTIALTIPDISIESFCCNPAQQTAILAAIASSLGLDVSHLDIQLPCTGSEICPSTRRQTSGLRLQFTAVFADKSAMSSLEGNKFLQSFSSLLNISADAVVQNSTSQSSGDVGYVFGPIDANGQFHLIDCATGFLLMNDSVTDQTCTECLPQTYSIDPLDGCRGLSSCSNTRTCNKCPVGAFCAGYQLVNTSSGIFSYESQQCLACLPGQYIIDSNADSCEKCPKGASCPDGVHFVPIVNDSVWVPVRSSAGDHQYRIADCPTGYTMIRDESFPEQDSCVQCEKDSYLLQPSTDTSLTCLICPVGGVCPGGDVVLADVGYWRRMPSPSESQSGRRAVIAANWSGPVAAEIFRCPPLNCLGNNLCRSNGTGPVCGICPPGWAFTSNGCEECPPDETIAPIRQVAIILACTVFGVFWFEVSWKPMFPSVHIVGTVVGFFALLMDKASSLTGRKDCLSGALSQVATAVAFVLHKLGSRNAPQYLKIMISYLQVISGFLSFHVTWPATLVNILVWIKGTVNIQLLELPGLSCLWTGMAYRSKLLIYTIFPLVIAFLFLLPVIVAYVRYRIKGWPQDSARVWDCTLDCFWNWLMFFAFFMYPFVSLASLRSFDCQPAGLGLLAADYREPCPSATSFLVIYSFIFIVLYPIGIPTAMFVTMRTMGVPEMSRRKVDSGLISAMVALFIKTTTTVESQRLAQLIGHTGSDDTEFRRRVKAVYESHFVGGGNSASAATAAAGSRAGNAREQIRAAAAAAAAAAVSGPRRLEVHVVSAQHLPKLDRFGTVDAFCTVSFAGTEHRTAVVKNTYAPTWDECFNFDLHNVADELEPLVIHVADFDRFKSNDSVGDASISAAAMASLLRRPPGGEHAVNLPLRRGGRGVIGRDGGAAEVRLILRALAPTADSDDDDERHDTGPFGIAPAEEICGGTTGVVDGNDGKDEGGAGDAGDGEGGGVRAKLGKSKLRRLSVAMMQGADTQRLQTLLLQYDENGDGDIGPDEFERMARHITQVVGLFTGAESGDGGGERLSTRQLDALANHKWPTKAKRAAPGGMLGDVIKRLEAQGTLGHKGHKGDEEEEGGEERDGVAKNQPMTRSQLLERVREIAHRLRKDGVIALPTIEWNAASADPREVIAVRRVGFLFLAYNVENWYWEMVEMLRKFLMTSLLVTLVYPGEPAQLAAGLLITFFFLGLNMGVCPYNNATLSNLQTCALVAQFITLFSGLMLIVNDYISTQQQGTNDAELNVQKVIVGVLIFFTNGIVLAFPVIQVFATGTYREWLDKLQRGVGGAGDEGDDDGAGGGDMIVAPEQQEPPPPAEDSEEESLDGSTADFPPGGGEYAVGVSDGYGARAAVETIQPRGQEPPWYEAAAAAMMNFSPTALFAPLFGSPPLASASRRGQGAGPIGAATPGTSDSFKNPWETTRAGTSSQLDRPRSAEPTNGVKMAVLRPGPSEPESLPQWNRRMMAADGPKQARPSVREAIMAFLEGSKELSPEDLLDAARHASSSGDHELVSTLLNATGPMGQAGAGRMDEPGETEQLAAALHMHLRQIQKLTCRANRDGAARGPPSPALSPYPTADLVYTSNRGEKTTASSARTDDPSAAAARAESLRLALLTPFAEAGDSQLPEPEDVLLPQPTPGSPPVGLFHPAVSPTQRHELPVRLRPLARPSSSSSRLMGVAEAPAAGERLEELPLPESKE